MELIFKLAVLKQFGQPPIGRKHALLFSACQKQAGRFTGIGSARQ